MRLAEHLPILLTVRPRFFDLEWSPGGDLREVKVRWSCVISFRILLAVEDLAREGEDLIAQWWLRRQWLAHRRVLAQAWSAVPGARRGRDLHAGGVRRVPVAAQMAVRFAARAVY